MGEKYEPGEPGQARLQDRAVQEQVRAQVDGHVQEHHGQRAR